MHNEFERFRDCRRDCSPCLSCHHGHERKEDRCDSCRDNRKDNHRDNRHDDHWDNRHDDHRNGRHDDRWDRHGYDNYRRW